MEKVVRVAYVKSSQIIRKVVRVAYVKTAPDERSEDSRNVMEFYAINALVNNKG